MKFERLIIGSILIIALILICSNYTVNEEYYTTSNVNELLLNYPSNQIFVSGLVTNIYPNGFEIQENKKGNITIYQIKSQSKVDLAGMTYIMGTLNPPNHINSTKVFTEKQWEFNSVIIRSIFGLILFLIIFWKFWKFNAKKMLFKRRK